MTVNQDFTVSRGATSVTLPQPVPGYEAGPELAQTMGQNAAGDWYVYDKSFVTHKVSWRFIITQAQWVSLEAFVRATIQGALNTFTVVDHRGNTYANCRLQGAGVRYRKTPGGRYEIELAVIVPGTPY